MWKSGIRPDTDVVNAINRSLEFLTYQIWEPLSLAADAAMREANVASWGTHVNATETKGTTASKTYPGFIRYLEVTNTSANGYLPTASISVTPGESVMVAALGRTVSGTGCRISFGDVTNTATFGTAITHSQSHYMLMKETVTIPAGCVNMNVRLGGQGASDVTDWQALWVIRTQSSTPFDLPSSYIDERFKLDALAFSQFTGNSTDNYVSEGRSLQIEEIPQDDYSFNVMMTAANPSFIQFYDKSWVDGHCLPWIQIRLPYSEQGTLSAEANYTAAPLHLVIARASVELLRPVPVRMRVTNGDAIYNEAVKLFTDEARLRTTDGPAQRQDSFRLNSYRN